MQYRKFGKLDYQASVLGFGCMRLPVIDNDSGKIDEQEAIKMVRYAIDNGVNYIDTAYPYHQKMSEPFLGKALKDGYREKVKLATKLPIWLCEKYEDFDKYLNEQLQKLKTDYIDFYLVHALSNKTWEKAKELGIFSFLNNAIADGRIKHAGFSFHDDLPLFKEIVNAYDWTFCLIQLNYMDVDYQQGIEGMKYAHKKGLAIAIMEPLKGGKLANEPNDEMKKIWNKARTKRTPVEWALRWIWNLPEVSTVLSGMSNIEQIKDNIKFAEDAFPNSLTKEELNLVEKVKQVYESKTKVDCTSCKYCIPCPVEIAIPRIFGLYNDMEMYGTKKESSSWYSHIIKNQNDASKCTECGQCEEACPQKLSIIKYLKEAHRSMTE